MSSHRTDKQCGFHSLDLDFGTLKRVFLECTRLHDNRSVIPCAGRASRRKPAERFGGGRLATVWRVCEAVSVCAQQGLQRSVTRE